MTLPRYPQSGQPVTADWARELVDFIRSAQPLPGLGIRCTGGPNGTVLSTVPVTTAPRASSGEQSPRQFDIAFSDGLITVTNVYYQIGDRLVGNLAAAQVQAPDGIKVMYAMINTASDQVSFAFGAIPGTSPLFTPDTMDGLLRPVALYVLNGSSIVCDLRGCGINFYK